MAFLSEPEIEFLTELVGEKVKQELLRQIQDSIAEVKKATDLFRRRSDYARNFPSIAIIYDHLCEEEKHHLKELQDAATKIRRETK